METVELETRGQWRTWLRRNHSSVAEIWLVFRKYGAPTLPYEDAICEALCWGWVDSLIKRLDDDRYARKFTPRKPDSRWSTINRKRYEKMRAEGLLQKPGVDRPPTDRSGDAPKITTVPPYIADALRPFAAQWEKLPPSCKRQYIGWIDSAKKDETKQKRLAEAMQMIAAGQRPGLK